MLRAYKLMTGEDGHSHVIRGSLIVNDKIAVESIHFEETRPHSSLEWHNAPTTQYVITLAGVLEFETYLGKTFTIHPGDVLIALDEKGSGHKWRLTNDDPWRRAYVAFDRSAKILFTPDVL